LGTDLRKNHKYLSELLGVTSLSSQQVGATTHKCRVQRNELKEHGYFSKTRTVTSLRVFNKKTSVFSLPFQPQLERKKEGWGKGGKEELCRTDHPAHPSQSHCSHRPGHPGRREKAEGIRNEMEGFL
jgi:hypothetical protein